jgi:RNA polymerase sigma factor (sigma-70 family)
VLERNPEEVQTAPSGFAVLPDSEIWNKFISGDQAAFIYIYNRYFDILFRFAYQFSHDQDFIKDCIQDLFIELNTSKSKKPVSSIRAYLMVSLRRKIHYYQKKASKFIFRQDLLQGYDFQMNFSHEAKIIDQQFETEKKERLNQAINQILSRRQRELIYYLYFEKLSIDEVAQVMQLTRRGAQNLLYKSIGLLKKQFKSIAISLLLFFFI